MQIAILVTNTDVSEFASRFPADGDKFTSLLSGARPDWEMTAFDVTALQFPKNIEDFDGYVISGSPASVHDGDGWIDELKILIRQLYKAKIPIFGACFGHQIVAEALGGRVSSNPDGWILGRVVSDPVGDVFLNRDLPEHLNLYAAHCEQVTALPSGAIRIRQNSKCPIAGFQIDDAVYTTQYHPEMDHTFIEALTTELSNKLPADVVRRSRESLDIPVDNAQLAESIARFFEGTTLMR